MNIYSKKIQTAIDFAMVKHSGQFRKGTDIPYIDHPLEALEIVSTVTEDEDVMCAAVLHDVIEDAGVKANELAVLFGVRVAAFVEDESENKRGNLPSASTWRLRKQETLNHFENVSKESKIIALGDKLSNIRAIHRDYDEIGEKLWARFNCKEKSEQGWYYLSLSQLLSELSDTNAWQEYDDHVKAVFMNDRADIVKN